MTLPGRLATWNRSEENRTDEHSNESEREQTADDADKNQQQRQG
jgi:hypothetical protein